VEKKGFGKRRRERRDMWEIRREKELIEFRRKCRKKVWIREIYWRRERYVIR
jgi:hypothetical protein